VNGFTRELVSGGVGCEILIDIEDRQVAAQLQTLVQKQIMTSMF
jgi:hypothetical protein